MPADAEIARTAYTSTYDASRPRPRSLALRQRRRRRVSASRRRGRLARPVGRLDFERGHTLAHGDDNPSAWAHQCTRQGRQPPPRTRQATAVRKSAWNGPLATPAVPAITADGAEVLRPAAAWRFSRSPMKSRRRWGRALTIRTNAAVHDDTGAAVAARQRNRLLLSPPQRRRHVVRRCRGHRPGGQIGMTAGRSTMAGARPQFEDGGYLLLQGRGAAA